MNNTTKKRVIALWNDSGEIKSARVEITQKRNIIMFINRQRTLIWENDIEIKSVVQYKMK